MKRIVHRFLKSSARAQDGSTVVEFALVIPILILLLFTFIEMGFMLIIKTNLQAGVTAGARFGTQNASTGGNTVTAITSAITQQIGFIDSSKVTISMQYYPSFSAISGSDPNNLTTVTAGTAGAGSTGSVVMYQTQYTYIPITPIIVSLVGSSKVLTGITYAKN